MIRLLDLLLDAACFFGFGLWMVCEIMASASAWPPLQHKHWFLALIFFSLAINRLASFCKGALT